MNILNGNKHRGANFDGEVLPLKQREPISSMGRPTRSFQPIILPPRTTFILFPDNKDANYDENLSH